MKELAILIPVGTTPMSSLVLTVETIETANEHFVRKGKAPVFRPTLIGSGKTHTGNSLFTIRQHKNTNHDYNPDMIIVPSLGDDIDNGIQRNKKNIEWILRQYKNGAEIASLCTGAFMLAAAGILDDRKCSTHWAEADTFRAMFPQVKLAIDKIITEERGVYTSGGALSAMNLILHIVAKYYDRETAIYCSKVFEVEYDREDQLEFIIFSGQKNHHDKDIHKAQLFMESKVGDKIVIEDLCSRFAIDRRNFDRRFKKATGNSPYEYLQRIKIEAAKKFLETSRKTVNEIMYEVGYSDVRAFRQVFRKYTGMSPVDYKQKYN
jgi:transcriptional regulator GlxA family with amidase domain